MLDHIAHVDRVLSYPGGSLLLAGRSGVGRRTAVRLVAHMHHIEIITPHVSRNYTIKNFKNDLKNVREATGLSACTCTCNSETTITSYPLSILDFMRTIHCTAV